MRIYKSREWVMRRMEKRRELTGVDEGMGDERNGKERELIGGR